MMTRPEAEAVLEQHKYDRTTGTRGMPEPARSEVKAALLVIDADDQAIAQAVADETREARRREGEIRTTAEKAVNGGALRAPRGA